MQQSNTGKEMSANAIRNQRILIVDDDQSMLHMLRILLEIEGYNVTCATNALMALDLLGKNSFSLMLTDYNMPCMNGLYLSELAKESAPDLKIILVTADSLQHLTMKAAELGIMAVMSKPIDIKQLFQIMYTENRY